jgi:hypothetical protein
MVKSYICTKPQSTGIHIVHNDKCPLLPEPGGRILLGTFHSQRDATEKGLKHFNKIKCCPFCMKEINGTARYPEKQEADHQEPYVSSSNLMPSVESALVCCIN